MSLFKDYSDWELQNSYSLKEEDQISVYRRKKWPKCDLFFPSDIPFHSINLFTSTSNFDTMTKKIEEYEEIIKGPAQPTCITHYSCTEQNNIQFWSWHKSSQDTWIWALLMPVSTFQNAHHCIIFNNLTTTAPATVSHFRKAFMLQIPFIDRQ